jgi:hypothetical protein
LDGEAFQFDEFRVNRDVSAKVALPNHPSAIGVSQFSRAGIGLVVITAALVAGNPVAWLSLVVANTQTEFPLRLVNFARWANHGWQNRCKIFQILFIG